MEFDQAVDQFQPPAALVIRERVLPGRPARAAVMDLGKQVSTAVGQPDFDMAGPVHESIGHQLADEELGEVGVLA
jgi:hypothetical protein